MGMTMDVTKKEHMLPISDTEVMKITCKHCNMSPIVGTRFKCGYVFPACFHYSVSNKFLKSFKCKQIKNYTYNFSSFILEVLAVKHNYCFNC